MTQTPSYFREEGPFRAGGPPRRPDPHSGRPGPAKKGSFGRLGSLGVLAAIVFGKLKWLVAGAKFMKFSTLISMVASVGAYSLLFGWKFALGFVLLIFVHEMGHALALRQQGIPAGAPVFIPFMGAVIVMKGRPRNAWVEAIVGIGGPILGTVGAALALLVAIALESTIWYALASTGFLLNLFNMIPISPLDGGRIAGAISRWIWVLGYLIGVPLFITTGSPILLLILVLGVFTLYRMWKAPVRGYYDIEPWRRIAMGTAYFVSLAIMVLGMAAADAQLQGVLGSAALASGAAIYTLGGVIGDVLMRGDRGADRHPARPRDPSPLPVESRDGPRPLPPR
jgi:Zn-dependent protease